MSKINVSELDFDQIKSSIRSFLQSQSTFQDYNFEGSGLSILLDVLAHNTVMNSFYLDMATNESFLDSAVLRKNVVSLAKSLGYTPKSIRSARATIDITLNVTGNPSSVTVPKDTRFTTIINGQTYTFLTRDSHTITADSGYRGTFEIVEGKPFRHRYTITSAEEKILIPNANADVSELIVTVQNSSSDQTSTTFFRASNLVEIGGDDPVYFLSETSDGLYELHFGDGVLGKPLENGNIVILDYIISSGPAANSASSFSLSSSIPNVTSAAVVARSKAAGGSEAESIASIKFLAPRNYEAQGRAVTKRDYETLILKNYPDLDSVRVWGGEENDPPAYGKVFVALKPNEGLTFSETLKQEIVDEVIKPLNILPIQIEITDPEYLFLKVTSTVHYDPAKTNLTEGEIKEKIEQTIQNFSETELNQFSRDFYLSKFSAAIDAADDSIRSNETEIKIKYRFEPILNISAQYVLNLDNRLDRADAANNEFCLSSTEFFFQGFPCYLTDNGKGSVSIFRLVSGSRVTVVESAGTIDYEIGKIILTSFAPTKIEGNDFIEITATPKEKNIDSVRDKIITIEPADISVTMRQA